jgi:hypothetical protein
VDPTATGARSRLGGVAPRRVVRRRRRGMARPHVPRTSGAARRSCSSLGRAAGVLLCRALGSGGGFVLLGARSAWRRHGAGPVAHAPRADVALQAPGARRLALAAAGWRARSGASSRSSMPPGLNRWPRRGHVEPGSTATACSRARQRAGTTAAPTRSRRSAPPRVVRARLGAHRRPHRRAPRSASSSIAGGRPATRRLRRRRSAGRSSSPACHARAPRSCTASSPDPANASRTWGACSPAPSPPAEDPRPHGRAAIAGSIA